MNLYFDFDTLTMQFNILFFNMNQVVNKLRILQKSTNIFIITIFYFFFSFFFNATHSDFQMYSIFETFLIK